VRSALFATAVVLGACAPTAPGAPETPRSLEQELNAPMPWLPPVPVDGGQFGHSLAVINVRGAYSLLAVGAPQTGDGGTVFIFDRITSPSAPPTLLVALTSPKPAASFGSSLLAIDLNADGADDLVVGAPTATENYPGQGLTYLYLSQPDAGFTTSALTAAVPAPAARFGTALAGLRLGSNPRVAVLAPGVNSVDIFNAVPVQIASVQALSLNQGTSLTSLDWSGDGNPDLVVGLQGSIFYLYEDGGAYSAPLPNNPMMGPPGFGAAFAPLGDVTMDGREDLIITSPTAPAPLSGTGTAVFMNALGFLSGTLTTMPVPTPPGALHFGEAVAVIGPFEGQDPKFVIGAPQTGPTGSIFMYSLATLPGRPPLLYGQFTLTAAGTGGRLGNAIVGNVDFDSNGQPDFAVGAETLYGTGAVQLIFGRPGFPACMPACGQCGLCEAQQCIPLPSGLACSATTNPCMPSAACDGDGGCALAPKCPGALCDLGRDAGCYGPTEFHIVGDANLAAVINQPYQYNPAKKVTVSPMGAVATFGSCLTVPGFNVDLNTGAVTWMPQTSGPVPMCIRAVEAATGASDVYMFTVDVAPASDFTVMPSNTGTVPFQVVVQVNDPTGALGWTWDFGDMGPGADGHATPHTYLMAGTYWIELKTTVAGGMPLISRQPVFVKDAAGNLPPTVKIESTGVGSYACPSCGAFVSYLWDFGDKSQSTNSTATLALPAGQRERVRLTVTDPTTGLKGFDYTMAAAPSTTGPPDCRLIVDPPVGNAPFSPNWWFDSAASLVGSDIPPAPYADAGEYRGYASSKDATSGTICLEVAWATALDEYGAPAMITTQPLLTANCGDTYLYAWSAMGAQPITYQLQGPPGAMRVGDSVKWVVPPQPGAYAFELVALNPVKPDVQDFTVTVSCDGGLPPVIDGGPPPMPPPAEYNFSSCGCQASGGLQLLALALLMLRRRLSRR
jgi:hypothetical protein